MNGILQQRKSKMNIKIEQQTPDGINISVDNLIVDSTDEANEFIKWIIKIWGNKKTDLKECERLYNDRRTN